MKNNTYPFIIHQMFLLARDLPKYYMTEYSATSLGNIWEYSPIFKTVCVAKKIWRIINTIASKISSDICPWTLSVPQSSQCSWPSQKCINRYGFNFVLQLRSQKTVRFAKQIMSADKWGLLCSYRKYPYSPHRRFWNFPRQGGSVRPKKFKEMYEA